MTPPLTVLLCVFDGQAYLREAIDSILAQTFGDFELLAIDDASRDATPEILASYADPRLRVVRNETNRGLTASLNIGLRLARGALVARHDADDRSHPSRFARQVAFLESHPGVAVLGSAYRYVNAAGRRVGSPVWPACASAAGIRWQLLFGSPFVHSSVMFRRAVILDELGGYDEAFPASQDFELWSRASRTHAMANLLEPLVELRAHGASISSRRTRANYEMVRDILRSNLTFTLGERDYEPWLDFWLTVNNAATYGTILNIDRAKSELAAIRARFEERYPEAVNEPEIDRTLAGALSHVSCALARQDRAAAVGLYAAAVRADAPVALRAMPRFAANVVLGPLRMRRPRSSPGGQST